MNVKAILLSLLAAFLAGLAIGLGIYSTFLCVDTNTAIVKQLDKDADAVKEIEKKAEIRYVEVEKIRTVIKTVPADECFDRPVPGIAADELLKAYNEARPSAN
jgi:hypothetical protein